MARRRILSIDSKAESIFYNLINSGTRYYRLIAWNLMDML